MEYKGIEINWLGHAAFRIKDKNGKTIYIDPFQLANKNYEKSDIIFITHPHYDHCSIEDIKKIIKKDTLVVSTSDVNSKIRKVGDNLNVKIVEPNQKLEVLGIKIETIPAYNIGEEFHPKNNFWLGYIIEINGIKIYHSGDCDIIPEMNTIKTDIALLPVGGTYTMNSHEAVRVAELIAPKLAIPMHYGSIVGSKKDAEDFVDGCKKIEIRAMILERN